MPPSAGSTPIKEPIPDDLSIVFQVNLTSFSVGSFRASKVTLLKA